MCADGSCLKKPNPECDFVTDCPDASDEKQCGEQENAGISPELRFISLIQLQSSIKTVKSNQSCVLQIAASGSSPVALWAGPVPPRGSGHGRPACRSGVPTSVGVRWYPASGWCRLPTVSMTTGKGRKREEEVVVRVSELLLKNLNNSKNLRTKEEVRVISVPASDPPPNTTFCLLGN